MAERGEKVFVTGGSGFLGSNLIRRLVTEGYKVSALLRPGSSHTFLEGLPYERVEGDLMDREALKRGMEGVGCVFHCAASVSFNRYDLPALYLTNVRGTKNALQATFDSGVKRFVHVSACAVLGYSKKSEELIDEDSPFEVPRRSVYAYTKKLAEEEVEEFSEKGLDCVVANPCTIYGQGDRKLNSGLIIKNVFEGRFVFAPPGGTSFVSVDDVVDGLLLIMAKGKRGERYVLCNGNLDYLTLLNRIARSLGVREIKRRIPPFFYFPAVSSASAFETITGLFNRKNPFLTAQLVKEVFSYKYYSSEKARRELGWEPHVGFGSAIDRAFDYYRTEGLI